MTIHTDSRGLVAGPVSIAAPDIAIPGYRARPEAGSRWPIVLVGSEIFGVHDYVADVCRRFAKLGWLAVAPELFVRQGDAHATSDVETLFASIISKVPDAQVMADLDATADWAEGEGGDGARLGITGFCWGGKATWLWCAHSERPKSGVAWYGRLVGQKNALQTSYPVDAAARLQAPVLGLYGGADAGIPLEDVETMKRSLAAGSAAATRSEFVVFPEARHAFHSDYRPNHDAAAAEAGWQRGIAWLRAHGAG